MRVWNVIVKVLRKKKKGQRKKENKRRKYRDLDYLMSIYILEKFL